MDVSFALSGIGLLAWGIWELRSCLSAPRRPERAWGTVIEVKDVECHDGEGGTTTVRRPFIRYEAADGSLWYFVGDRHSGMFRSRIGDAVQVQYAASRPDEAHMHPFDRGVGSAVAPVLLGTLFIVVAVGVAIDG